MPRALTVLGEAGACVVHDPRSQRFSALDVRAGTFLCSDPDGTELFFLQPRPGDTPVRLSDLAVRAAELHERFVHRQGRGLFNAVVPPPHTPRYLGELVVVRYTVHKALPDVRGSRPQDWEHYFEEPGIAPAYPPIWSIGNHQYWVPPGPFSVEDDGIVFHPRR